MRLVGWAKSKALVFVICIQVVVLMQATGHQEERRGKNKLINIKIFVKSLAWVVSAPHLQLLPPLDLHQLVANHHQIHNCIHKTQELVGKLREDQMEIVK